MIYLDYTANTPADPGVLDTYLAAERRYIANPNSTHIAGQEARAEMERVTQSIAQHLGVQPAEIIYTSGASEANNLALKGIAHASRHIGKHIISTQLEHSSVGASLSALQQQGYEIDLLDIGRDGRVDLDQLREELMDHVIQPALQELPPDADTEILINPSGRFVYGGFEADTGLTGRKLMVDTYGGLAPHGGGALSGKDATKVDRSGAYMARYIAKNIVSAGLADRCTVTLAYAIGKAEPVAANVDTDGTGEYRDEVLEQAVRAVFDLTPAGMRHTLGLDKPIFAQFCNYGHFTHPDAPWEQTEKAEVLCNACRIKEAGVSDR